MAERPRNYTFDPPPGVPRSNSTHEAHTVAIHDARPLASEISLDREGFAVLHQQSAVRDFWDEDEVRRVYYPEVQRVLAEVTGASKVFIFDHTLRRRVKGAVDWSREAPRQPATRVHVDHTANSGPQRVRDFFGDEAEALLRGRVQVINLWRPIRGPLRDAPLAVCDAESVAPGDLVASDLVYQHRVGETYGGDVQSVASVVLCAADAAGRGAAVEVLRLGDGRPRAVRAAHRVRGSDRTGGRAAAREHRDPDAGVPRGLNKAASDEAANFSPSPCGRGKGEGAERAHRRPPACLPRSAGEVIRAASCANPRSPDQRDD